MNKYPSVGTSGHIDHDSSFIDIPDEPQQGVSDDFSDTYHSYGNGPGAGARTKSPNSRKKLLAKRKAQRTARKKQRNKK